MENEISSIIELLKSANDVIFPAALHAAKVTAIIEYVFGGIILLISFIIIYLSFKNDSKNDSENDNENDFASLLQKELEKQFISLFGAILCLIGILLIILGIYNANTLEYQAFKMIMHR